MSQQSRVEPWTRVLKSKEERKMLWMHETMIRLLMQMELEACRNELDWLIIWYLCAVHKYSEEYCPPMPLPVSPRYQTNLEKKAEMPAKGILPLTLKTTLKSTTRYQCVSRQFCHVRKIHHARHRCRALNRSHWGMTRLRVILSKHR